MADDPVTVTLAHPLSADQVTALGGTPSGARLAGETVTVLTSVAARLAAAGYITGSPPNPVVDMYLRLAGGTMTGPIVLPGDPAAALQAATKAYVDAHAGGGGGSSTLAGLSDWPATSDARYQRTPHAVVQCAAPTGVASTDQAAINTALAALPPAGGTVQLQGGTYVVPPPSTPSNGCVSLGDNTVLAGYGMGVTIIQLGAGSVDVTGIVRTPTGVANKRVTVRDLTIDGNAAAQTGTPRVVGFYCGTTPGASITDTDVACIRVEIMNCVAYGFDPHEKTTRLLLLGCVSHGNGTDGAHDGFTLDGQYEASVIGCVSFSNGRHGFNLVTSSNGCRIIGCDSYSNGGSGLVLQNGTKNCVLSGNNIHDNTADGVLVNGLGVAGQADPTPGYNNAVKGNTVRNNGQHGIHLIGATGQSVTGNTVRDSGQATTNTYSQVMLDESAGSYSTGNTVIGNDLGVTPGAANAPKYGVAEATSNENSNLVTGNQVGGAATAALNLLGANTLKYAAHNGAAGAHPAAYFQNNAFNVPSFRKSQVGSTAPVAEQNFDLMYSGGATILVSGIIYYGAMIFNSLTTLTNFLIGLKGAGATLTAGQSLMGLYTQDGTTATLVTASESASYDGSTGTGWANASNAGLINAVALGTPQAVTPGQVYLFAIMCNGTTPVTLSRAASSTTTDPNMGLAKGAGAANAPYYWGASPAAQTALPSSFVLSSGSFSNTGGIPLWFGAN